MRIVRAGAVMLLAPALAGCFKYAPVEMEAVRAGDRVRAGLTAVQAAEVAEQTGRDARVVAGDVLHAPGENGRDRLLLSIPARSRVGDGAFRASVEVDPTEVTVLEVRTFDAFRTTLVAVVGGVAAAFAVDALFDGFADPDGPEVPGPDQAPGVRIPVLRLPF